MCRFGEPQQINVVAGGLIERAGALVAWEHGERDKVALMIPRPCLGMGKQCFAYALAFVARHDGEVGDMAVGASGKVILRFLQMDETYPFAVIILGDEDEAVGRLFVQMAGEVFADALNAFVPFAPGWQVEINKAWDKTEDEIIVILGESDQKMAVAHALVDQVARVRAVLHPKRQRVEAPA